MHGFRVRPEMATMEQVVRGAVGVRVRRVELGGFFDHARSSASRTRRAAQKLREWIVDELNLEIAGIAPGPYGDLFRLPWATGSQEVYDEYLEYFEGYLQLAADMEIPGMRVDPGAAGPLPDDADYNAIWERVVKTFQHHADARQGVRLTMLWELESLQPFNKPPRR